MKSILLFIILNLALISAQTYESTVVNEIPTFENETLKKQAFTILKTKCNICHEKKNKRRVFTSDNMDGYGKKIYKQVFKWKRMPKGSEIKLTTEEYSQLKSWLLTLDIK